MNRLERAATGVHLAFWKQVGPTADWPVRLEGERAIREQAIRAIGELDAAVREMAERTASYHDGR